MLSVFARHSLLKPKVSSLFVFVFYAEKAQLYCNGMNNTLSKAFNSLNAQHWKPWVT